MLKRFRGGSVKKGIAFQRNFVIDPKKITPTAILNLERVLRLYARLEIRAGLIYTAPGAPADFLGDIANLADMICFDYGNVERASQKVTRES